MLLVWAGLVIARNNYQAPTLPAQVPISASLEPRRFDTTVFKGLQVIGLRRLLLIMSFNILKVQGLYGLHGLY